MKDATGKTPMRGALRPALSASLLLACSVSVAQARSPAAAMVWALSDASTRCQNISGDQHLRQMSDNGTISLATMSRDGSRPSAFNATAQASINRKLDDSRYDACMETARTVGKAAYQTYQTVPGQSQAVRNDVEAIYIAWMAALPDLTRLPTPHSAELSALEKAVEALRVDDAAR